MILVDIQIPVLDKVYDFELDEELETGVLLEDILRLVEKQEGLDKSEGSAMYLYALRQERILRRDETLGRQGVRDGDRLILI